MCAQALGPHYIFQFIYKFWCVSCMDDGRYYPFDRAQDLLIIKLALSNRFQPKRFQIDWSALSTFSVRKVFDFIRLLVQYSELKRRRAESFACLFYGRNLDRDKKTINCEIFASCGWNLFIGQNMSSHENFYRTNQIKSNTIRIRIRHSSQSNSLFPELIKKMTLE